MFSCEFCEIFKNTFFYRTPDVAASVYTCSGKLLGKQSWCSLAELQLISDIVSGCFCYFQLCPYILIIWNGINILKPFNELVIWKMISLLE